MQFEDFNFDENKDNVDLSFDNDSNSISWEDLLNADDDVDISGLIKNMDKKENEQNPKDKKPDNNNDVNSPKEPVSKETIVVGSENEAENINTQSTFHNLPLGDTIAALTDVDDIPTIDLDAVASDYTNSIQLENAENQQESSSASNNNSLDDIIKFASNGELYSGEKNIAPGDDDDDDISFVDSINSGSNADNNLSALMDDELLNILNEKDDNKDNETSGLMSSDDDIMNVLSNDSNRDLQNESQAALGGAVAIGSQDLQDNENIEEDDEFIDSNRNKKSKSKAPFILIGVCAFILILVLIFFALAFMFGSHTGATKSIIGAEGDVSDTSAKTKELIKQVELAEKSRQENTLDKRIVVPVSYSGRSNPFVPSTVFGEGSYDDFSAAPPDIDLDDPKVKEMHKMLTITVSGIMYDDEKPSAILNYNESDFFVQQGDKIDSYTVYKIAKDHVAIKGGKNIYNAYVGEAFQTDENNKSFEQHTLNNGKRQYISPKDTDINKKE